MRQAGPARHGTARHGTARHGTARHGTAGHGTAKQGKAGHGRAGPLPLRDGRQLLEVVGEGLGRASGVQYGHRHASAGGESEAHGDAVVVVPWGGLDRGQGSVASPEGVRRGIRKGVRRVIRDEEGDEEGDEECVCTRTAVGAYVSISTLARGRSPAAPSRPCTMR